MGHVGGCRSQNTTHGCKQHLHHADILTFYNPAGTKNGTLEVMMASFWDFPTSGRTVFVGTYHGLSESPRNILTFYHPAGHRKVSSCRARAAHAR